LKNTFFFVDTIYKLYIAVIVVVANVDLDVCRKKEDSLQKLIKTT